MYLREFIELKRATLYFIFIGLFLRLVVSIKGNNSDFEAYKLVVLALRNGITPWETYSYNYGIIWAVILFVLDFISFHNSYVFRILIILVLASADLYIATVIANKFGHKYGVLFFLNPISILITGYYNQFDNLGLAIGLCAIMNLNQFSNRNNLKTIILLTLSLMTKHNLVLFLPWIFFNAKLKTVRYKLTFIPAILFSLHFTPFMLISSDVFRAIYSNVFMYWSANNAPFWQFWFRDKQLVNYLSDNAQWHHGRIWMTLFFLSVTIVGIWSRKKSITSSFFLYCIIFVLFSSAITTQFYAIGAIGAAAFFNRFFLLYFVFATLWIFGDPTGLDIEIFSNLFLNLSLHGWNSLPFFLLPGILWMIFNKVKSTTYKKR